MVLNCWYISIARGTIHLCLLLIFFFFFKKKDKKERKSSLLIPTITATSFSLKPCLLPFHFLPSLAMFFKTGFHFTLTVVPKWNLLALLPRLLTRSGAMPKYCSFPVREIHWVLFTKRWPIEGTLWPHHGQTLRMFLLM
uniref:Uncharacterized protein n=1 Tax=Trypanosoma vivax (strain Y486) TaxID=1055687 RepID=G0U394_TRYVY|nr:hypothetical protein TVY486_0905710 [Trypanosoma vivax Y486]